MKCPRCGEEMTGGICDNCGFPLTKMRKKFNNGNKRPRWKPACKRVMGNKIH